MDYKEKVIAILNSKELSKEQKEKLEEIFPELSGSEDERIRKSLIILLQHFCKGYRVPGLDFLVSYKDMLAWLEKQGEVVVDKVLSDLLNKVICHFINEPNIPYSERDEVSKKIIPYVKQLERQGEQKPNPCDGCINRKGCINCENGELRETEQKPTDEVEPKFHEGDWVVYDHRPYQVVELPKEGYINLCLRRNGKIEFAPSTYCKHWTIQDAMDGDVLYSPCLKLLWIYNKDEKTCYVGSNLNYNSGSIVINKPVCIPTDVQPATKEQRDTLMKAMDDAGYTFNFVKKELRKIEQKSAWSEEDIIHLNKCISYMSRLDSNEMDWLKSLKPQNRWKPSDEQMKALADALSLAKNCGEESAFELRTLHEQLTKLKENKL